jgi:hypothetical protein
MPRSIPRRIKLTATRLAKLRTPHPDGKQTLYWDESLGERAVSNSALRAILKPFPAKQMECFEISTRIGNVKYDEPSLMEPV